MDDLATLRIVGLKGQVPAGAVAESLGLDPDAVAAAGARLADARLLTETTRGWRLTERGRAQVAAGVAAEGAGVDRPALRQAYDGFCTANADLKQIVTDWQLKGAVDQPNDHSDPDHDGAVLGRLAELHRRVAPLLDRIGDLAPRLARYGARLDHADRRIADGDHTWVARPVVDSYHTVWFELHEDLIGLLGLRRSDEAAAGRAQ